MTPSKSAATAIVADEGITYMILFSPDGGKTWNAEAQVPEGDIVKAANATRTSAMEDLMRIVEDRASPSKSKCFHSWKNDPNWTERKCRKCGTVQFRIPPPGLV